MGPLTGKTTFRTTVALACVSLLQAISFVPAAMGAPGETGAAGASFTLPAKQAAGQLAGQERLQFKAKETRPYGCTQDAPVAPNSVRPLLSASACLGTDPSQAPQSLPFPIRAGRSPPRQTPA